MPYTHGRRKKRRTHLLCENPDSENGLLSSKSNDAANNSSNIVITRGRVHNLVKQLKNDVRKIFLPYTPLNLKENTRDHLNDYIRMACAFRSSSLIIFSMGRNKRKDKNFKNTRDSDFTQKINDSNILSSNLYLRICKMINGPTLTLKINSFTQSKEHFQILNEKKIRFSSDIFSNPPLVILKGFNTNKRLSVNQEDKTKNTISTSSDDFVSQLIKTTISNLLPSFDFKSIKLNTCRRVVLFHYSSKFKSINIRHYGIIKKRNDVSEKIQTLLELKKKKQFLDLSAMNDIGDYILSKTDIVNGLYDQNDVSETVILPSKDRSTDASEFSLKLYELGPRIEMELIKIEEELFGGKVLFHAYIKKSITELYELESKSARRKHRRKIELIKHNEAVRRRQDKKIIKKAESRKGENENDDSSNGKIEKSPRFNPFSFSKIRTKPKKTSIPTLHRDGDNRSKKNIKVRSRGFGHNKGLRNVPSRNIRHKNFRSRVISKKEKRNKSKK